MGVPRACCLTIGLVCVTAHGIATAQIADQQELTLDGARKVIAAAVTEAKRPGGLWVLSPAGKHLDTIIAPRYVHNMA